MKKLKNMKKEELELMSYTEIAKIYLIETKKTINTAKLFKEICNLLELSEREYENQIADFFQSLTTSKEFILLDNGEWDLKSNHTVKIVIDDIEDDVKEEVEEEETQQDETEPDDLDTIDDENYINDDEDDLSDLTIVTDEELEE